eukprot:4564653-Pleurochrysis_carterae.AAC.1
MELVRAEASAREAAAEAAAAEAEAAEAREVARGAEREATALRVRLAEEQRARHGETLRQLRGDGARLSTESRLDETGAWSSPSRVCGSGACGSGSSGHTAATPHGEGARPAWSGEAHALQAELERVLVEGERHADGASAAGADFASTAGSAHLPCSAAAR